MKKFAMVAAAMIALLGFTGCDLLGTKDAGGTTSTSSVSSWKIKGSFDGWTEHNFVIDEIDANKVTYQITGLFADSAIPIVYEFVLLDPAGKEYKASGAQNTVTSVTPGTAFTLGDSSVTDSSNKANVGFVAAKAAYTVSVNIGTATAPSVNLIGGATDATAVTNAILADKLTIKGDAFSIGWTETAGTFDAGTSTVSFDVTYSSKNGSFGFSSLDNFLKGVTIDLAGLTAGGAGTAGQTLLKTGVNAKLTNAPKASGVYTVSVLIDVTKTVADGRYVVSAKLKTASTTDWEFEAPASIFLNGNVNAAGWTNTLAHDEVTLVDGVATINYSHGDTDSTVGFKYYLVNEATWNNMVGIGGVDGTGSEITISGTDNIEFAALADTSYTITLDFSDTFVTTGKPVVNVSVAP